MVILSGGCRVNVIESSHVEFYFRVLIRAFSMYKGIYLRPFAGTDKHRRAADGEASCLIKKFIHPSPVL